MFSMFLQVELGYIVKYLPEERKNQLNNHAEVNDEFLLSKQENYKKTGISRITPYRKKQRILTLLL
ncbi:hypothetical protein SAMN04488574_11221 [Bacillus sp. 71mf]|uniref:hypothetical protein n=2 Tax=unclassified Bacillus (in: firmicutes) TaxID=185979 RepID=UPI0008EF1C54|nr:hypothetical protein [Bacillus sp. 103mf]SFJ39966.1 hypothetical protein SAMN04488574_11221 [Bacillus sp. 71mf]SFT14978.1 hypothetical protein SAMN04488145_11421 [Bacillus sp. 103mf]